MRVGAGDRVLQPPVGLVCVEEALGARSRACKATHTHACEHTRGDLPGDLRARAEPTLRSLPAPWHQKEMIYLFS